MRRLSLKDSGRTLVLNISVHQNHLGGLGKPQVPEPEPPRFGSVCLGAAHNFHF